MQPQLQYLNYVSRVRRRCRPQCGSINVKLVSPLMVCFVALVISQASNVESKTLGEELGFDLTAVVTADVSLPTYTEEEIQTSLKRICRNKKEPITSTRHMRSIIFAQFVNQDVCKEAYKASFNELDPIIRLDPKELCGEKAINLIKDYHFRFIRPPVGSTKIPDQFEAVPTEIVKGQLYSEPDSYIIRFDEWDNPILVPIAVRHFFLAFVLQVSASCKKTLVKNLKEDSKSILKENDNALLLMFDEQTPIGSLLSQNLEYLNFDNVVHIPELDGPRKKSLDNNQFEVNPNERLFLKTSAKENSALIEMIDGCQNRFKPFYEKLFMPIIRLSKMGYEYVGPKLSENELQQLIGTEVKTWLSVIHICELFSKVHIVKDEPNQLGEQGEDNSNKEASGDTSEEAANDEGLLKQIDEKEVKELMENSEEIFIGKPVEYTISHLVPYSDPIWILSTKELDLELSRKPGNKDPFGFFGVLRRIAKSAQKALSKLDLERFAHYRQHSLWYNGILNFLSSAADIASIIVTFHGMGLIG